MEQALEILKKLGEIVPEVLSALMVLATVVVRFTPSKADDKVALSVSDKVLKAIHWLPTIGVNPKTKALEDAYLSAKAKIEALEKKE
jgi:hypothetical protein